VPLVGRTDQLRGDPHEVPRSAHASFEQVVRTQLTPDLVRRALAAFELEG
jgi:hypothetical protein